MNNTKGDKGDGSLCHLFLFSYLSDKYHIIIYMTLRLRMASILMLTFFVFSCNRPDDGIARGRKAINALMDSVECIMDDDAIYADSLMKSIDSRFIKTRNQRARYALLNTAIEYKNDQVFTSDSLIMEAVRYYSKRNNIDYRFLSYYYLGCVYFEMDREVDASVAWAQAELLENRIDNDHWKGLLYTRLGIVFSDYCYYNRAKDYFTKSVRSFEKAGRERHRLYSLLKIGHSYLSNLEFSMADSIYDIVEKGSAYINDSILLSKVLYSRLSCYIHMNELDLATNLLETHSLFKEQCSSFEYLEKMTWYYSSMKDFEKAEYYLDQASQCDLSVSDSVYLFYLSSKLAKGKGNFEESLDYYLKFDSLENKELRKYLTESVHGAQYDNFRTTAELEAVKTRHKITLLVASIIVFFLIILSISLSSRNKRRQAENRIQDCISTINDLTTQISVNKDKISNLNAKVREMIRNQFNPSDYLYTRYYEQIDDSKKAEHVYRVVRNQLKEFTNAKNLQRIDELLDEAFDGIMSKLLSSGLEFKEKDWLLLRFALAGFSAKSIAAILDETHQNINQRKKRMLDKIQIQAPKLMEELRIALNNKQIDVLPSVND